MTHELLFEIGVEEIPSAPLYAAIEQLQARSETAFDEAKLGYERIQAFGGPRRLVVRVSGLASTQHDEHLRVRGPAVKAGIDPEGGFTRAAEGFARGQGVEVASLVRDTDDGGGEYLYAVIDRTGRPAIDVLPEILSGLASGLEWPKAQRWGSGDARFIRPVRWIVALLDDTVVPVSFAGLVADRVTFGHRFLTAGPLTLAGASAYDAAARDGKFVYDHNERARRVRELVDSACVAARVTPVIPEKTFREVCNLVEWPSVGIGRFDEEFLRVPREVLETAMTTHQRYFPTEDSSGTLTNAFVVVHNGDEARTDAIVTGHERVIRARLADAAFFWDEDLSASIEQWVGALSDIVFHERIGTLGAKVERVERLAGVLATLHGADPGEQAEAVRAAHLAKADLVSHVVVEFPSLQGVMGRYYALEAGETDAVATAVLEHYRPRFAGDTAPSTVPGMLVSAADRLDTMCGIFAIGQGPTGSADPYALRRGAIGIITMLLDGGLRLPLDEAIAAALSGYSGTLDLDVETVGATVKEFILARAEVVLRDRGFAYDTVSAVLQVAADDIPDAYARCEALQAARSHAAEVFEDLSTAFTRARNLCDPTLGSEADLGLMGPEERALADALVAAESSARAAFADRDYDTVVSVLASLRTPIDAFFDAVLVMDPDEGLRANRLKLLNRFVALFERFADLGRIGG